MYTPGPRHGPAHRCRRLRGDRGINFPPLPPSTFTNCFYPFPTQDGYVLAQILAYAQKKGPLEALSDETMALYNRLRPPIANFVHERARLQGLFYEFNEEGADLGLVEKGSPFYLGSVEGKDEGVNGNKEEAKKLTKLGHGMQDGYLWWKHSIVRETDAAVKRALA